MTDKLKQMCEEKSEQMYPVNTFCYDNKKAKRFVEGAQWMHDEIMPVVEELLTSLKVISTNGAGRGMGWTPAQQARISLAKTKEKLGIN